jgi:hypothetical protein
MLQVAYLTKHCSQPLCIPAYVYEVRPRKDHRGVDLISDVLSRSPDAINDSCTLYDSRRTVIELPGGVNDSSCHEKSIIP